MKSNLLRLLEWHTRACRGQTTNTWLLGRRIRDWVDDQTYAAIEGIWSSWNTAELWHSLLMQIELFRRLSLELTQRLGYPYSAETYRKIERYIRKLRDEDRISPNPT